MSENERISKLAAIVEAAYDRKGEDIVAFDVRKLTSYADIFVIITASSDRRARSIADSVNEAMSKHASKARGVEGYDEGLWLLLDLDDVIVHIFQDEVRREYDLERLWSDAPLIEVAAPAERTAAQ